MRQPARPPRVASNATTITAIQRRLDGLAWRMGTSRASLSGADTLVKDALVAVTPSTEAGPASPGPPRWMRRRRNPPTRWKRSLLRSTSLYPSQEHVEYF